MELLRSPDLSPRIRVLLAVAMGHGTVEAVSKATGLSMNTSSKWLNVLAATGLVKRSNKRYVITNDGAETLCALAKTLITMCPIIVGKRREAVKVMSSSPEKEKKERPDAIT